ncbi:type VI secretion system tube protein Hcp [Scandinavium goeteborgense]|nr:type VI secretion system tube protein Hcp [Scandinavium goeteborgense]
MSSSYGVSQPVDASTGRMGGVRQHAPYIIHKQIDKIPPLLANCVCQGKRMKKAVISYYEINEAGLEREVYRVTMTDVVIQFVNANHTYIPVSKTPNMLESVGLRYNMIEWFYLESMIKYDDAWSRPAPPKEDQK